MIANLQARLAAVENQLGITADNPFVSEPVKNEEPPTREDGSLTKDQAVVLASVNNPDGTSYLHRDLVPKI